MNIFSIGSELRAWLLFYSLPVLTDVLPAVYVTHFSYLVAAFQLLLSDCITVKDLLFSHKCLSTFYSEAESLYGKFAVLSR